MKQNLLLSLIVICAISCSSDNSGESPNPPNPPNPTEYSISVDPTSLSFESIADSKNITVTSSHTWSLSGGEDWCTPSAKSGTDGSVINFSVQTNESTTDDRSATYTFTCGDKTATLTVKQEKKIITIHTINVANKGTLSNILTEKGLIEATHLKITGVLGDLDFLTINEMKNKLVYLDISEIAVTVLLESLFQGNKTIQQVILPKTLTEISKSMFGSSTIKEIVIPINVKTICERAFRNCTSLVSIEIPASVETIEYNAFVDCTSLTTVTFNKNTQLKNIGYDAHRIVDVGVFSGCTSLISIEIPASVEEIGSCAFMDCTSLTTVTFEKGSQLKVIRGGGNGSSADLSKITYLGTFSNCISLISIEIPASVEEIGSNAFRDCTSLTTVTFEKGSRLKTIKGGYNNSLSRFYGAFYGCNNLKAVNASACTLLKSIEITAFSNSVINLFQLGAITPPSFVDKNISGNVITYFSIFGSASLRILKVPDGSVNVYQNSDWNKYFTISGFSD